MLEEATLRKVADCHCRLIFLAAPALIRKRSRAAATLRQTICKVGFFNVQIEVFLGPPNGPTAGPASLGAPVGHNLALLAQWATRGG